jgi:hypothetical protein
VRGRVEGARAGVVLYLVLLWVGNANKAVFLLATMLILSFDIMIALLIVGFLCNELIKPVDPKYHEPSDELVPSGKAER